MVEIEDGLPAGEAMDRATALADEKVKLPEGADWVCTTFLRSVREGEAFDESGTANTTFADGTKLMSWFEVD